MTLKTDLSAITPTSTAIAAFEKSGTNITALFAQANTVGTELQRLLKQIIAFHPSTGGDASNYTALTNLLAELN